ncbi:hypothetical protein M406DRAFT_351369 [Cryphonectria parasitica EP155]|uniref:Uncharacterized protein n=1 Tax=Cryphonectria parasitica (strain ATCC 38755 / EP155) TaxID=660469 RepID=A0A9P4Y3Z2_CRYP1|nr:uncharacterized protein M406DRAFT_351369 [Cryphonectria parasitica EP155]KAF3766201.1 hypothetical protein M406DRAFT_351369 [Cryphonectria parasitica EP155]
MHPGMRRRSSSSRAAQGRSIWSCGPCMILLLLSVVLPPRGATAMFHGSGKRDTVHRVFKVKVTEDVRILTSPSSSSLVHVMRRRLRFRRARAKVVILLVPFHFKEDVVHKTCPTGYFLCPASMNYGCCETGMGCAVSSCYSTSPSTTTITYTTTTGSHDAAVTVTTTSVSTPTSSPSSVSSSSGDGAVAKFFPSTEPKLAASSSSSGGGSSSSGGHSGLSKGAIGGIVAGAAVVLVAVLVAAFCIIRQLKRTEKIVQSHRETTSGGTRPPRRDAEKRSESHVRIEPTPTEVDHLEDDPLMINNNTSSSAASPGRRAHHQQHQHQQLYRLGGAGGARSRSGSDAPSQPSVWSGPSAGMRATPSLASDVGDGGGRNYFELPPREHDRPGGGGGGRGRGGGGGGGGGQHGALVRHSMASTMDSSAQYDYHNFVYAPAYENAAHGRHPSEASELSAGASDDYGPAPRGPGSPSPRHPFELGVDGEWRPELPGSDTDNDSNNGHKSPQPYRPRRSSSATAPSINNLVSPMSASTINRPPLAHANRSRRRGASNSSSIDGQKNNNNNNNNNNNGFGGGGGGGGSGAAGAAGAIGAVGGGGTEKAGSALGSIEESSSVTGTRSLHGHYGPPVTGPVGVPAIDLSTMPGFVPGFIPLEGHSEVRPSQDESERY